MDHQKGKRKGEILNMKYNGKKRKNVKTLYKQIPKAKEDDWF